MGSADVTRMAFGVVGNAISLFLFLSPTPTFIRIWRKGRVEQYSPVPYLATLLNCMVWVLYGIPWVHPNSILVVTINGAGTAIEVVYIAVFLIYCSDVKKRVKIIGLVAAEIAFIAVLATVVILAVHTHERRSMVVGIVAIVFNIMMYASPLAVMKLVIRTKSVEFMPFALSLASLTNALCWLIYGLIRFDLFLVLPNGIGLFFGVTQLTLYAIYYKSTKEQIAARRQKGETALSEVVVNGDGLKNGVDGPQP